MDEVLKRGNNGGKSFRDLLVDADNKRLQRRSKTPNYANLRASGLKCERNSDFERARHFYCAAYTSALNSYGSLSKEAAIVLVDRFRVEIATARYDLAFNFLSQALSSVCSPQSQRIQIDLTVEAAKALVGYEYFQPELVELLRTSDKACKELVGNHSITRIEVLNSLASVLILAGQSDEALNVTKEAQKVIQEGNLGPSLPYFESCALFTETLLEEGLNNDKVEGVSLRSISELDQFLKKTAGIEDQAELVRIKRRLFTSLSRTLISQARLKEAYVLWSSLLSEWKKDQPSAEDRVEALRMAAEVCTAAKDLRTAWYYLRTAKKIAQSEATNALVLARVLGARAQLLGELAFQLHSLPAYKIEMLLHGNWSTLLLSNYLSLPEPVERRFSEFDGENLSEFIGDFAVELRRESEQIFAEAEELLLSLKGAQGAVDLTTVASLHCQLLSLFGDVQGGKRLVHNLRSRKHVYSYLVGKYANLFEAA